MKLTDAQYQHINEMVNTCNRALSLLVTDYLQQERVDYVYAGSMSTAAIVEDSDGNSRLGMVSNIPPGVAAGICDVMKENLLRKAQEDKVTLGVPSGVS